MVMRPAVRRAALSAHVIVSVGWIGAAAAYLSLGILAQVSTQPGTVQAAWAAMDVTGWYVIVPLAVLAWSTGLLMAAGTTWGLLRHYWVLFTLTLTTVALAVLVLHMPSVSTMAARTEVSTLGAGDVVHPALGLVVLIAVAVLNIYKPQGMTRYGRSSRRAQMSRRRSGTRPEHHADADSSRVGEGPAGPAASR